MAKWITIKYAGSTCAACKEPLEIGTQAKWYRSGVAYHKCTWHKDEEGNYRPGDCIVTNPEEETEVPF